MGPSGLLAVPVRLFPAVISRTHPENRLDRKETERFKAFTYEELIQRDKANLDIIWIKDESLQATENLPEPEMLAEEIIENLRSVLEEFEALQEELENQK